MYFILIFSPGNELALLPGGEGKDRVRREERRRKKEEEELELKEKVF
ncbi:hypothetical protein [Okeania sp. SIO1I7]|nr:hypothetical protein [Okeania sp. SIO1I7]NET26275.1 hypothetical protein [Okeania sp. SIO1I7]